MIVVNTKLQFNVIIIILTFTSLRSSLQNKRMNLWIVYFLRHWFITLNVLFPLFNPYSTYYKISSRAILFKLPLFFFFQYIISLLFIFSSVIKLHILCVGIYFTHFILCFKSFRYEVFMRLLKLLFTSSILLINSRIYVWSNRATHSILIGSLSF